MEQIEYALGSSGRSFVVGFGNNPPLRPHHASSSCQDAPAACDWGTFNDPGLNHSINYPHWYHDQYSWLKTGPNPLTLYGALVGGPGDQWSDDISDQRNDFIENEVTLDYNAGFQSTLAGLLAKAC